MYGLALWEFNSCIKAYNHRREAEQREETINAWRTANWTGAAFAGKLKPLRHYIGEQAVTSPSVTHDQMAAIDKRFEERRRADGV